jgi:hypothetical protein
MQCMMSNQADDTIRQEKETRDREKKKYLKAFRL